MRFRKLRIAWSVFWGIVCLLLIALWVRSYWKYDCVSRLDTSQILTSLESRSASISFAQVDYAKTLPILMVTHAWKWESSEPGIEVDTNTPSPSFEWSRIPFASAVRVPHWFPVLISAALATVP